MKKKFAQKIVTIILILTLAFGGTATFADDGHWQLHNTSGNIDIKVSNDHRHKMEDVAKYLNAKYGGNMDTGRWMTHVNIVMEYEGDQISNAHVVKYRCPACGKIHYLVYDHIINKVTYDTPCDDDGDVESLGADVWDNVKDNFDDALDKNDVSFADSVRASALYLLMGAAIIGIIVYCPVAVLAL